MSLAMRRDPFARQELVRHVYPYAKATCSWCGQQSKRLFRYQTHTDGGRVYEHKGAFCNIGCHDAYHG